ncbi:acyl-CoA dehydrogenase family protein [Streptomyces sp. NBC_00075]|uniref:acyl-CoA dehydrogenase family protein n=1 Tax=Streptomyces sp. NBC_00075 TaxID=2975641 RepID=UPI00324EDA09
MATWPTSSSRAPDHCRRGEAFRTEVRALFGTYADRLGRIEMGEDEELVRAVADRGWLGFTRPEEAGGRNASPTEQVVLNEEAAYQRAPAIKALGAVTLLGDSILRHRTPDQKEQFLPLIRSGQLTFCLGYSEPEAGSDLASLRTRAVRDGEDWVINGQKLWTSGGHEADWLWLAVRTDPDAPPAPGHHHVPRPDEHARHHRAAAPGAVRRDLLHRLLRRRPRSGRPARGRGERGLEGHHRFPRG